MKLTPLKTPLIEAGQSLLDILLTAMPRVPRERDILCVTSKVISVVQGKVVRLDEVTPSEKALAMRRPDPSDDPHDSAELMELILQQADRVMGMESVWLTIKDGILVANAGIDLSNVPPGYAVLWPDEPWEWAHDFRRQICARVGTHELGILITDSRSVPMRRGVIGVAMSYSGFLGVESQKGKPDLYGRPLAFTEKAVADDLASAAVLVAGEAGESTPFVLIEDAPVVFSSHKAGPGEVILPASVDLFASIYSEEFRHFLRGG